MDASQYKDYVLVLLFVKYVSDKANSRKNYLLNVPKGARFADMVALKGSPDIGDKMNQIVAKLAAVNDLKDERTGTLKTFDFVVANPPFSSKAWSSAVNVDADPFKRFDLVRASDWSEKNPTHVVPPQKNGDYAFLLHILACLKSTGKGAVILPHGVLFRGNAEADIRREVVRRGFIKGIIGLPANLFYGTGIPACILVLDKEGAQARKGIFMIDASRGFIKDGNKNRLREQDIHKIVDTFTRQAEVPRYSRMVPLAERREAAKPRLLVQDKKDKDQKKDKPDFTVGKQGFKAELVPPSLLIARTFAAEQAAIDELEAEAASCAQSIEELVEEHGGDEGLLEEAKNDKDKVTKASVAAHLKVIARDPEAADERKVLETYLARSEQESSASAKIKTGQEALTTKLVAKYGKLTEEEIKTLVVEDKWLAAIVSLRIDGVDLHCASTATPATASNAPPISASEIRSRKDSAETGISKTGTVDIKVLAIPVGNSCVESSPRDTPRNGPNSAPIAMTTRPKRKVRSRARSPLTSPPGATATLTSPRMRPNCLAATATNKKPAKPKNARIWVAAKLSSPSAPRLPNNSPAAWPAAPPKAIRTPVTRRAPLSFAPGERPPATASAMPATVIAMPSTERLLIRSSRNTKPAIAVMNGTDA
jgi:hypothetical protein